MSAKDTSSRPVDTQAGLRLGVAVDGELAVVALSNVGTSSLRVLSYVDTGAPHYDWFELKLIDSHGTARVLDLKEERDEAGEVEETLGPGLAIQHRVDVQHWATRSINGGARLAAGSYELYAKYEVKRSGRVWTGRLDAGPVTIVLR